MATLERRIFCAALQWQNRLAISTQRTRSLKLFIQKKLKAINCSASKRLAGNPSIPRLVFPKLNCCSYKNEDFPLFTMFCCPRTRLVGMSTTLLHLQPGAIIHYIVCFRTFCVYWVIRAIGDAHHHGLGRVFVRLFYSTFSFARIMELFELLPLNVLHN